MRKKINEIYAKSGKPFNRLWEWAGNSAKKFKGLTDWSEARRKQNAEKSKKHSESSGLFLEKSQEDKKEKRKVNKRISNINDRLKAQRDKDPKNEDRIEKLSGIKEDKLDERQDLSKSIKENEKKASNADSKSKEFAKRASFWLKKRIVYRKEFKKLKASNGSWNSRYRDWMLNNHPSNIHESLKGPIAYAVLEHGQTITSTTDLTHSTSSLHYPRNNSSGKGHAFDCAGNYSKMQECQRGLRKEFGDHNWKELFGPDGWYLKNSSYYGSQFPNHHDHNHAGTY